ncbi:MAG TPA: class I SAM-dependent methyltransferase [Chloroflexia bacterium]|nr:class I SAM-dependent methyltransferase [Chloroflexia bacterium]
MESVRGQRVARVDAPTLSRQLAGYPHTLIDIGTGDGRFVRHVAAAWPGYFAIGVDSCAANLRERSRQTPPNALYLVASAHALPPELARCATHLTINFPWGSLLAGLLDGDSAVLAQLTAVAGPGALLEVRLNGGALAEAGWALAPGMAQVQHGLARAGFVLRAPVSLGADALRACPTTWAHRLAFGRDPRALYLRGTAPAGPRVVAARPDGARAPPGGRGSRPPLDSAGVVRHGLTQWTGPPRSVTGFRGRPGTVGQV